MPVLFDVAVFRTGNVWPVARSGRKEFTVSGRRSVVGGKFSNDLTDD
jgi:hypothetical protein